ncbi:MAG: hypothetical protein DMD81_01565, partial [Candidatus Rokuibacteriota bacterium]
MSPRWRALLAVAVLLAASQAVHAQQQPPSAPTPAPEARPQTPVTVPAPGGDVTVLADRLEEIGPDRVLVATGNVEVSRGSTRLVADRVEMNRLTGDTVATGRVILYDAGGRLTGERLEYNLRTGTGVLHGGEVQSDPYYRITGERFERRGESIYHVLGGALTTCSAEPPEWSIHFGSADADLETGVFGRSASFWVRNLPLIPWFPFFAAALGRDRQTGFLFPRVGHSATRGYQAEVPFYWAISDSQDLTVALTEYTKRGTGLTENYRYSLSAENHGQIQGFYVRE